MDVRKTMESDQQNQRTPHKPKRFRSAFTTGQISYLEQQFRKFPYISREHRKEVASVLKIDERPIKIWFQNRRMKEKKEYSSKEFNDEINICNLKECGIDQLNNVPVLPSTNDQRSYSLPKLTTPIDTAAKAKTNSKKVNIEEHNVKTINKFQNSKKANVEPAVSYPKANFYKEVFNQNQLSAALCHDPTLPFIMNRKAKDSTSPYNASAEFSIDLCKKYLKQESRNVRGNVSFEGKKNRNLVPQHTSKRGRSQECFPEDLSASKKLRLAPAARPPNQLTSNTPVYYPVMPTIYAPPLMSSGGVFWKPVNIVPVMTTTTTNLPAPSSNSVGHEQCQSCQCNCHGSTQHIPVTFPQSPRNQYAQYMISVPFTKYQS